MKTWEEISARQGRNDLPLLLCENYADMNKHERAKAIADTWVSAEFPAQILDIDLWLGMFFDTFDFDEYLLDEGEIHLKHDLPEPLTLWRGALPDFAEGMSWSSNKEKAEWFAHRLDHDDNVGVLYEATIDTGLVLAKFDGRGEFEYVIDVTSLDFIQDVKVVTS
jgi:hypothetical protein